MGSWSLELGVSRTNYSCSCVCFPTLNCTSLFFLLYVSYISICNRNWGGLALLARAYDRAKQTSAPTIPGMGVPRARECAYVHMHLQVASPALMQAGPCYTAHAHLPLLLPGSRAGVLQSKLNYSPGFEGRREHHGAWRAIYDTNTCPCPASLVTLFQCFSLLFFAFSFSPLKLPVRTLVILILQRPVPLLALSPTELGPSPVHLPRSISLNGPCNRQTQHGWHKKIHAH